MTRPTSGPTWATDAAYTHGPVVGQSNKCTPSSGERAEGFIPTQPLGGDEVNFILNEHGAWIFYLDQSVGAGLFGDGSDGALVFDGVATILGMVPVAGLYSTTRDILATDITFTGNAKIDAAHRIFATGTLTTLGSSINGGGIITHDGGAGGNGVGGVGGAVGPGATIGTLRGGVAGGAGGSSANGAVGVNATNSYSGAGGRGGNSNDRAFGLGGTVTAPSNNGSPRLWAPSTIGYIVGLVGGVATVTALDGGSGGGGGAGSFSATAGGGGGGGSAGALVVAAKVMNLKNAADIRAAGGAGGNGQGGTQSGAGGGGGGGTAYIVYAVAIIAAGAFGVAINAPGGVHGTSTFDAGVAGANGALYQFIVGAGGGSPGAAEQRAVVPFASAGSGAGFDFQDVTLSLAMPDTSYEITLTVGLNNDVDGAPQVSYRLKTTGGFRIRTNAKFDGEVSWTARPA